MDEYERTLLDVARQQRDGASVRDALYPTPAGLAIPADGTSTPIGITRYFTPGLSLPGGADPIRP